MTHHPHYTEPWYWAGLHHYCHPPPSYYPHYYHGYYSTSYSVNDTTYPWSSPSHTNAMAATTFPSGGFNPIHGRDSGPPPPPINQNHPYGLVNGIPLIMSGSFPAAAYHGTQLHMPPQPGFLPGVITTNPTTHHPYQYPPTLHSNTRTPQPSPTIDPHFPAANLTNSTGGVGCEPGYNYFFPAEHTKIIVLKCGDIPPWQLHLTTNPNTKMTFYACHVPVNTTVTELMAGFGANNPDKKLNQMWEVVWGPKTGKWYKGLHVGGEDKAHLKKTIGELGWDSSRTGLPGGREVVYLYLRRD